MKKIDRRQWLKTAGLTGAFSMLSGMSALAAEPLTGRPRTDSDVPIRLSSNENPYGPSPKVRTAIREAFDMACRYPFSYAGELRERLAERHGVTPDHITITAGSTEGLKVAGLLYGMAGGEIIAAEPTFKALMGYAEQFGAYVNWVLVDDQLQHDLDAMEGRITNRTSLVYVCNPNNPTGSLLPADTLRNFCELAARRTMVFVDEAYFDFIEDPHYPSMVDLVKAERNVIVARTFSKVYGLAGLRIGYLVARPDITARLREHRVAFTNTPALFAAQAALDDEEFYQFSLQKTVECRQMIYEVLDDLGRRYVPSQTNFVFFETGRPIRQLIDEMLTRGVHIGRPFPPLESWCRISTGTTEETAQFCEALRAVMG